MKLQAKLILIVIAVVVGVILFNGEKEETPNTLQAVLSTVDGIGEVFIYYEQQEQQSFFMLEQTTTSGVLIVCEGCHLQSTKHVIVDTVSAVLNIPPHQIKVLPLTEGER